jgi:hypothetical protein
LLVVVARAQLRVVVFLVVLLAAVAAVLRLYGYLRRLFPDQLLLQGAVLVEHHLLALLLLLQAGWLVT